MPSPSPDTPNSPPRAPARAAALALAIACVPQGAVAQQMFDCVIDPSVTVKVGSPLPGVLASVLVQRGDVVAAGQPIAQLESRVEEATVVLNRARAESTARIDAQQARLDLAKSRLGRTSQLAERQWASKDSFEEGRANAIVAEQDLLRERQEQKLALLELERSVALLEQRTIRSPISGVVSEKKLSAGEFIHQEGYVMTIAQLDPLHVETFLPVAYYGRVSVGMTAIVRPDQPIGGSHPATVKVVDRVFDAASGTFGVRLALPNPGNALPGGQRCRVTFEALQVAAP